MERHIIAKKVDTADVLIGEELIDGEFRIPNRFLATSGVVLAQAAKLKTNLGASW